MTSIVSLADLNAPAVDSVLQGGVISIGNFDGVHRGHALLLREVRRQADKRGCPAVAVTLFPHPAVLLRPESAPPRLTWLERRAERMHALGIDQLIICETTSELLSLTAESFFELLAIQHMGASGIVEGPNFYFGRDRAGDINTLGELCQRSGIELSVVTGFRKGHELVSSTRIRDALNRGNVHLACDMLGDAHRIRGRVVAGDGRGRTLGFPTANLDQIDVVVPAPGVYAGWAMIDGGLIRQAAAIHVGQSPTFDSGENGKVEVHLLDHNGDLYGHELYVDFVARVRDVARFESGEQLTQQLHQDVDRVRKLLRKSHS
ncbi:bifunctional riboflavin kinase/FAD synthetase [Stieleria varia]|uniref:Riboflavin biosynthesis protein n=1 Tax=Stieleria varia TaxID=2528005 RepID=A0A5C6AM76_9BACT|nr:bifunctional riboflavin kinase/FAD synthetase [Stieleria varia]TWU00760.1 Riboflavin kinase [Stieleria varia]